jgi:hypothetical protein
VTAAVRALGAAESTAPTWTFPLCVQRYDQRAELTDAERHALGELGPKNLRRNRARGVPRRTAAGWRALSRLVGPLDTARGCLPHGEDARFRRAGAHAMAIILGNCVQTGRSYWAWTAQDWAQLCASSAETFIAAQTLPTETTVRPFVVALGYLLAGFDDFHHLGTFNRLHLACLVFGTQAVEQSLRQASAVLDQWGYRSVLSAKHRLRGVFSQALLINRRAAAGQRGEVVDSPGVDVLHAAGELARQIAAGEVDVGHRRFGVAVPGEGGDGMEFPAHARQISQAQMSGGGVAIRERRPPARSRAPPFDQVHSDKDCA